jgi:hypothetical protein
LKSSLRSKIRELTRTSWSSRLRIAVFNLLVWPLQMPELELKPRPSELKLKSIRLSSRLTHRRFRSRLKLS